jgi:hypothetical protein
MASGNGSFNPSRDVRRPDNVCANWPHEGHRTEIAKLTRRTERSLRQKALKLGIKLGDYPVLDWCILPVAYPSTGALFRGTIPGRRN